MVPLVIKRSPVLGRIVQACIRFEERWFDRWHNVETGVDPGVQRLGPDHFIYEPTRPGRMRAILRELPIDHSQYVFVDVGSGKGRPLLIASEFPFQAVKGVERDRKLHAKALANINSCRRIKRRAGSVESVCTDATQFEFPLAPLVLYFFNPFGRNVMERIMSSLAESLNSHPRDVFIVMFNPEFSFVVDATPAFKFFKDSAACRVYRSHSHVGSERLTAAAGRF